MPSNDERDICREDREEVLEALYRLERDKETVTIADLMLHPDLRGRPIAEIIMELALAEQVEINGDRVALTPKGREAGQRIYLRHELAERVLKSLGLREPSAHEEACRVEHLIDDQALATAGRQLGRFEALLERGCIRLSDAPVGEYIIVQLTAGRFQRRRLEDMGLGQGSRVRVLRGRHGGPVEVEAHGARLALGRGVASRILVTSVASCLPQDEIGE